MPPAGEFDTLSRDRVPVRSLAQGDLEALVRIDRKITGQRRRAYLERKLDEALQDSGVRVSLLAEIDGAPAGFVMAQMDFGEFGRTEPVAVIDTIGVDPGFAGRGVGKALLSQLLINLAALGVERLETTLSRADFALLGFLYRCGFEPSERLAFVKKIGVRS
jgi:GNAT superfamily N-acetyltransferase